MIGPTIEDAEPDELADAPTIDDSADAVGPTWTAPPLYYPVYYPVFIPPPGFAFVPILQGADGDDEGPADSEGSASPDGSDSDSPAEEVAPAPSPGRNPILYIPPPLSDDDDPHGGYGAGTWTSTDEEIRQHRLAYWARYPNGGPEHEGDAPTGEEGGNGGSAEAGPSNYRGYAAYGGLGRDGRYGGGPGGDGPSSEAGPSNYQEPGDD